LKVIFFGSESIRKFLVSQAKVYGSLKFIFSFGNNLEKKISLFGTFFFLYKDIEFLLFPHFLNLYRTKEVKQKLPAEK